MNHTWISSAAATSRFCTTRLAPSAGGSDAAAWRRCCVGLRLVATQAHGDARRSSSWWRWGRVELPVQSPSAATTTSVSGRFRQPSGRGSALSRSVQSRASRASLIPDYATLIRAAAPLHDASTTHGTEVASTLTLPPKRRGRESTACWQLLRFAACLTRPDGTSARVHCQPDPVETTHPHRIETRTGVSAGSLAEVGESANHDAPPP